MTDILIREPTLEERKAMHRKYLEDIFRLAEMQLELYRIMHSANPPSFIISQEAYERVIEKVGR